MPTRTHTFASLAAAVLLAAATAGIPLAVRAQSESTQLPPQTKVRITAPRLAAKPIVGTILDRTTDNWTVAVQGEDSALVVPVASVRYLEVSRGSKRRVAKGLVIGFLAGAVMGAVVGYSDGDDDCSQASSFCLELMTAGGKAAAGGLLFGGAGAVVGGLVGLHRTERWETVPLDRPTLGIGPARGGGIALTARLGL